MTAPQKITFGEMRASCVRDVLIYCRDHRCSHHVEANADGWADDVRLSDIQPKVGGCRGRRSGNPKGFRTDNPIGLWDKFHETKSRVMVVTTFQAVGDCDVQNLNADRQEASTSG